MKKNAMFSALLMGTFALTTVGCGNDGVKVTLGTAVKRPSSVGQPLSSTSQALAPGATSTYSVTDGTNTLVFNSVKLTLEDIDLERQGSSVDCDNDSNDANDDASDCSDYFAGPILLDLDMSGQVTPMIDLQAQVGTYSMVSFDISVPDGGEPEQQSYLTKYPDMRDASLRVAGTFNGQPFNFATAVRGDKEVAINPPLQLTEDSTKSFGVDLKFDLAKWFRSGTGTLIAPQSICALKESCASRDIVENNIRNSVESGSSEDADEADTED